MDQSLHGLHGPEEPAAFAALPKFSTAASAEICRLVLMQALPALAERDIAPFGAAITQVQALLGDYFAPAQGGRFTSPRVSAALASLLQCGAAGVGQSSWGPTGFVFARDEAEARRLAAIPRQGVDMLVCSGLNHAATITKI